MNKLKSILIITILFTIIFPFLNRVQVLAAEENLGPANVSKELQAIDLRGIEDYINKVDREVGAYLPKLDLKQMVTDLAKGELHFNGLDVLNGLLKYLFKEIVANSKLIGQLIVLAIICSVLQNIQSAFEEGTVSKLAYGVCYLVIISLAMSSFTIAVQIGRETIDAMVGFMKIILPILLTLLASMGNVTSTAIFHPILMTSVTLIGMIIKNIIFPLIFFSVVLGIVTNISEKFQVTKLAGLFKEISVGLLGLLLSVFLGVIVVNGVAGTVADGVTLRTAKYVTGTFVPVIGGMFSDALEAVVGASLLLKNSVGLVGVMIIFALCLFPLIKILSIVLIYKVSGAIIQPLGNEKIVDCLNSMGKSLILVFAAVASVGLMFFFVIAIVVGAGNLTTMLR